MRRASVTAACAVLVGAVLAGFLLASAGSAPSSPLTVAVTQGRVLVRSGSNRLGFSFAGLARGSTLLEEPVLHTSSTADRVVLDRGAVQEWYVNSAHGLEQGFTLAARPLPASRAPLRLELRLSGNVRARAAAGGGLTLDGPGGSTLTYSGLSVTDARGRAVRSSLSTNGSTIAIDVDDAGAAYPLRIDPFIQEAELTGGNVEDTLGGSVAIGGNLIVAGAPQDLIDPIGDGYADVYVEPPTGWSSATASAQLWSAGFFMNEGIGTSVAISNGTIAVGAPGGNNGDGLVYVYTEPPGGWHGGVGPIATITPADGTSSDGFGSSVAIDGNTIVIGSPFATASGSDSGKVYVAVNSGSGWPTHPQVKLTASPGGAGERLGTSVSISGNTIAAGAPNDEFANPAVAGKVYVFDKPAVGGWATGHQTATISPSDGVGADLLGKSVAITGGTIVAGAPNAQVGGNPAEGKVYVFTGSGATWNQGAELEPSDGAQNSAFGGSVAIDGTTIVAGLPNATVGANQAQGALYVFREPPAGWTNATQSERLTASDGSPDDSLGYAVAVSGDTIVGGAIGFFGDDGAAYAFGATPPSTSIGVSPAAPNGQNGWYVSPVRVAVSGADDIENIAAVQCALDPAAPPASAAALPPGCQFTGAGAVVSADGIHGVYAASVDANGQAGQVAASGFKIDTTPPTVTCQSPPTFLIGKPGLVTATVADATSGPASAVVAAPARTATAGRKTVALTGSDNAGNSTTVECAYTVQPHPIGATVSWTDTFFRTSTVFNALLAHRVPPGARIAITCKRKGCPFAHRTIDVPTTRLVCKRHHRRCTRKAAPASSTVNLEHLFAGHHLAAGDKLTITITKTGTIGIVYTFVIEPAAPPHTANRAL